MLWQLLASRARAANRAEGYTPADQGSAALGAAVAPSCWRAIWTDQRFRSVYSVLGTHPRRFPALLPLKLSREHAQISRWELQLRPVEGRGSVAALQANPEALHPFLRSKLELSGQHGRISDGC